MADRPVDHSVVVGGDADVPWQATQRNGVGEGERTEAAVELATAGNGSNVGAAQPGARLEPSRQDRTAAVQRVAVGGVLQLGRACVAGERAAGSDALGGGGGRGSA